MSKSRKVGPVRVRPHVRDGKPTGRWFVDIPASVTGNGHRKRRLYESQRIALQVARELKRRCDPLTGQYALSVRRCGVLFREAVEGWRVDENLRVDTLKKRASTLTTDLYRLKALVAFFGNNDIVTITGQRLSEYQRWRLQEGRKPRTINSELGTLSLVLNWALGQGYISEVPKTEQIPVERSFAVVPRMEEVARIIDALPERLRPIVRFLAETGCRKGEALNLTWECVDELNGWVEIKSHDDWKPKTQQSARRIPLGPPLVAVLRNLPKDGLYVFPGKEPNKPIDNFRKAFATAVAKADIRRNGKPVRITPQSLRRAHATWQAMRGVNESVLQDLLGHAPGSRVTRRFYVQPTEEAKMAAVIQLPIAQRKGN